MGETLYFSFSSLRQISSKQGGVSRSTKQEQAAPWKEKHQLRFQRGEEPKALSLPGIPVSQKNSTDLKKPAENCKMGIFLPMGKGVVTFSASYTP